MIKTTVSTTATVEPLSLEEVKDHLRLPRGYTEEDDHLNNLIIAARQQAEAVTRRKLITQTVKAYFNSFPNNDVFELPYGSLQSVSSVTYKNSTNNTQTLTTGYYTVDTINSLGRIVLTSTSSWPSDSLHNTNPITITYVCGYGLSTAVPAAIKSAMKTMISHIYENREPIGIGIGLNVMPIPKPVDDWLLAPYKLFGY